MNEILIFIKIFPLVLNTLIPVSFSLVKTPTKLNHHISFNVLHILTLRCENMENMF